MLPFTAVKDLLRGHTGEETFTPLACHVRPDAYDWLEDEQGRDQFAIAWSPNGRVRIQEVMWSDGRKAPTLAFPDEDAGDLPPGPAEVAWRNAAYRCYWSPKGTYLATLSERGVQLWSGSGFSLGPEFPHKNVRRVSFSPDESYMLTWSGYPSNSRPDGAIQVWDIRMGEGHFGKCLRPGGFKQRAPEDDEPDMAWSSDGKFLARLDTALIKAPTAAGGAGGGAAGGASATAAKDVTTEQVIMLYDLPSCKLNDSRSIRAPGARAISFAPAASGATGNLLAYWSPEREPHPATIIIMAIPSREMVRQRNVFNVEEAELHWHPSGSMLAVAARKTRRRTTHKSAETGVTTVTLSNNGHIVEVFRCKDKGMPVFSVEIKREQGELRGFYWEPSGTRFALVVGDRPRVCDVLIYNVTERGCELVQTYAEKACQRVFWSPNGEYAVFAGVGEIAGQYEFMDIERNKSLASVTHAGASGASWDPSGRTFASYKCRPLESRPHARDLVDNGYQLYTFQGVRVMDPIFKAEMLQFEWRPRPASLLTDEEKKLVASRLRGFQHKYQLEAKKIDILATRIAELETLYAFLTFTQAVAAKDRAASSKETRELRAARGLGVDAMSGPGGAMSGVREETTTYEEVVDMKVEVVTTL